MKRGHVPVRTCRGCGRRRPRPELVRFVAGPGGLQESATGAGRGIYCCPSEQCMMRLRRNKKIVKQALRLAN